MYFFEKFAKGILCSVVLLMAGTLLATDYTWKYGGTDYKWSTPGNWLVNGEVATSYPKGGDKAIFSKANVTASIILESETVDLGSGELTIQVDTAVSSSRYVYLYTIFSGSAKIIRTGVGRLYFGKDQSTTVMNLWTGGLELRDGRTYACGGGKQTLGTGTVKINPVSQNAEAWLSPGSWDGLKITNRIEITKDASLSARTTKALTAIYTSNGGSVSGSVFADCDFSVGAEGESTGKFTFSGPIEASGHTIHTYIAGGKGNNGLGWIQFGKSVNASLVLHRGGGYLNSRVIMAGKSENVDNSLTIIDGSNTFSSASAYWGGTNIVINPNNNSTYYPRLKVVSAANINPAAVITLWTGGTGGYIEVPSGVALHIRRLVIDGTDVGNGTFTSSDYSCIVGSGSVVVTHATWIGGDKGKWSEAANWADGKVPKAGDQVYFSKSVHLESETFDFGDTEHPENVLTIDVASGMTVASSNVFSGANALVKTGQGIWNVIARHTYSGGTIVKDGTFLVTGVGPLGTREYSSYAGTGTIELRRSSACQPHLELGSWCQMTNRILITGPYKEFAHNFGDIKFNNVDRFYSDIEVRDDAFRFHNQYNNYNDPLLVYGDISAHGLTMYATTRIGDKSDPNTRIDFFGTVDANIEKGGGCGPLRFREGSQIGTSDSMLTLLTGTNVAHAVSGNLPAAKILANAITVDNAANKGATLRLYSRENLQESAAVVLTNGGKLMIAKGVRAAVASLTVDGTAVPNGIYSAATLPDAIVGEGRLRVGEVGISIFIR